MDAVFNGNVASALFNTLITVTVPILVTAIVIVAKHAADYVRAVAGKEQWSLIEALSARTVSAVEQSMGKSDNDVKRYQAIALLKLNLKRHGIALDDKVLAATIEASVKAAKDAAAR